MTEASITVFDENLTPLAVIPWALVPPDARTRRKPGYSFALKSGGVIVFACWRMLRDERGAISVLSVRDSHAAQDLPQALLPAQAAYLRRRIEHESLTQVWASLVGP